MRKLDNRKRKWLIWILFVSLAITSCGKQTNRGAETEIETKVETETEQKEPENEEDDTPKEVPQLSDTGRRLEDFVPEGWKILDSVELDFNEDGMPDYVGVLESDLIEWSRTEPEKKQSLNTDGSGQKRIGQIPKE